MKASRIKLTTSIAVSAIIAVTAVVLISMCSASRSFPCALDELQRLSKGWRSKEYYLVSTVPN